MPLESAFDRAFEFTVGVEGGLSLAHDDDGNWTGGKIGQGELKGTKYGISAAEYPQLDIANLTLAAAKQIYFSDYWTRISGDLLPEGLALVVFDVAVNGGQVTAVKLLQMGLGITVDGYLGPATLKAVRAMSERTAIIYFQAEHACLLPQLKAYPDNRRGWFRRLIFSAIEAAS